MTDLEFIFQFALARVSLQGFRHQFECERGKKFPNPVALPHIFIYIRRICTGKAIIQKKRIAPSIGYPLVLALWLYIITCLAGRH